MLLIQKICVRFISSTDALKSVLDGRYAIKISVQTSTSDDYNLLIIYKEGVFHGKIRIDADGEMTYAAIRELKPANTKFW